MSDRAHPRDLAPVGVVEAKRTFLVMTKLVPGNAISGWFDRGQEGKQWRTDAYCS